MVMSRNIIRPESVIKFWFEETDPELWWKKDANFDQLITERFEIAHHMAIQGGLALWRETPLGRLAEIIVLDQFSRNIYRESPLALAYDEQALALAQEAIQKRADQDLKTKQRAFLYLPFMHSESREAHETALILFKAPGLEFNYDFELKHKVIIDRFGRYPHRNEILGRESTQEEIEFLKEPGSSF
jgi:uncharacterized protein (DUF924 family)